MDLNEVERHALLVLLTGKVEQTSETAIIHQRYPDGKIYELILYKLYKPGNVTEEQRVKYIHKLEEEIYSEANMDEVYAHFEPFKFSVTNSVVIPSFATINKNFRCGKMIIVNPKG